MHNFSLYFSLGRQHIANLNGLDHILFIVALCIRYNFADWKKILLLITAFTVGHSITLALSVFNIVHLPSNWVEFLIPVTIFITAVSNLFVKILFSKANIRSFTFFLCFLDWFMGLVLAIISEVFWEEANPS